MLSYEFIEYDGDMTVAKKKTVGIGDLTQTRLSFAYCDVWAGSRWKTVFLLEFFIITFFLVLTQK